MQKAHLPAFLLLHACLTFSLITVSLDGLACRFLFSWKLYSNFPTMKIGPTSCYCLKHSDTWNPQFPVRLIGMITWRAWPPHKCVRGGSVESWSVWPFGRIVNPFGRPSCQCYDGVRASKNFVHTFSPNSWNRFSRISSIIDIDTMVCCIPCFALQTWCMQCAWEL